MVTYYVLSYRHYIKSEGAEKGLVEGWAVTKNFQGFFKKNSGDQRRLGVSKVVLGWTK